LSVYRIP